MRKSSGTTVTGAIWLLMLATFTALVVWLFDRVYASPAQQTAAIFDVRVNQGTTADQHEPTLAVDPTNPNNVLVAAKDWRTGPKQVWYYRSTDGGRTWADGHVDLASELPNQSDPVLAFDAEGGAYLAMIGYNQNDSSVGGLFIVRSSDAGRTWGKPTLAAANSDTIFHDKEWIAVDRTTGPTRGNLYLTWTRFTELSPTTEKGEIVISRSTDAGKTFSPPKVISLPGQDETQGSFPAVAPNGDLHVLYYNNAGQGLGSGSALYIARSTDGGVTFAPARKVSDVVKPPSPLPTSSFRMFVLPALTIDPKGGNLYATWNDSRAGNTDTMLTRSTDQGRTWGTDKRVNDDTASLRRDQFFPAAIAGADGTLHLLWLDRREDAGNKRYAPYYARSTDGGVTFGPNTPLTRVQSDPDVGFEGVLIGDYIAVDVSRDGGRVYAAWVDTRNGDQDIYFASFTSQGELPTRSTPTVPTKPPPAMVPSPQPLTGFSHEEFLHKWERSDRPVLTGKAQRPWIWGPVSFGAAYEAYAQGPEGKREVQYFDKARMEINRPGGDRDSPFYVTNGLLVVELIGGRIQIGDAQFEPSRPPSQAIVAGDTNSVDALTYASLAPVASLNGDKRAADRTGQPVTAVLNRAGVVRDDPARAGNVKLARYEQVTGHNIPDLFWTFMNQSGPVYNGRFQTYSEGQTLDWLVDLGYPITEPYWTSVKVTGAQKWVLVQAFQRRVLTYVADNPSGWKVEMGNVGRHYFSWRYGR